MTTRRSSRALALVGVLLAVAFGGVAHAEPSNDNFVNAELISSLPFQVQTDTTGATTEAAEPSAFEACAAAGASVWYQFTPSESARLAASTAGSSFDAFAGVYEGDAIDNLTLLGCGRAPLFSVAAGKTYWFQIGGSDIDASGNLVTLSGPVTFTLEYHGPVPAPCTDCPTFTQYPVPDDVFAFAHSAGETSIGYDYKRNAAMFLMLSHTLRATWDADNNITWKQVDGLTTSKGTNDPILWTDPSTSRTFVVQLRVAAAAGASIVEYTDDAGATWTETEPAQVNPSWDHESMGSGPYPAPLTDLNPIYKNALYYCAQLGFPYSQCIRSDDGGLTWGAPLLMDQGQCLGLHGHIIVGADGTIYVPHRDCDGTQGILVSTDAATTWQLRRVPGTKPAGAGTAGFGSDPKAAFDAAGRLYYATSSEGKAVATSSTDGGKTWAPLVDVGAEFGIRNSEFPMVIAGSDGRAAMAFYGTQQDGTDQAIDFGDEWHLYVSFTYDGGAHWKTVDTTPTDPVQRGCIWLQGGSNACRNLLDFQDMTVDGQGRVLVGYADGCTTSACRSVYGSYIDSHDSQGAIARQTTGKGLLAQFDGQF